MNYVTSLDNFNADPALNKKFYSINKYNKNISPRIENLLISHIDKNIFDKIKISTEITRELQETSVGSEVKNFSNIYYC